ncbi:MAG: outer membrane beta-barrel protein [Bacteroidota bacterium]
MNAFLNIEDFDNRLRILAGNAESELPEGSWERLQLKKAKIEYNKKFRLWIYLSSITMAIIILAFVFYNQIPFMNGKTKTASNGYERTSNSLSFTNNLPSQKNNENAAENEKPVINYYITQYVSQQNSGKSEINKNNNESNSSVNTNTNDQQKTETGNAINYYAENFSETTTITENSTATADSVASNENIAETADTAKITTGIVGLNNQDAQNEEAAAKKDPTNEIHIGFFYNLNIPWILNQNTYGEFGGKELAYKFGYGSAYGIMIGYDVEKRYGFQTGIIINSSQGQKYHDTFSLYGTVDREIALDYFHIPLLYKFKFPLNDKANPAILNIAAGLQYGHLKKAEKTVNGIDSVITERFNRSEIGFVLNIESDFYFANSFYFTFGLNSSIGSNINQKDWEQYVSHANGHSYNMLVGAVCGLSYYFPVK